MDEQQKEPSAPEEHEEENVWPLYTDSLWYRLLGPMAPMARFVVAYTLLAVLFTIATRTPNLVRKLFDEPIVEVGSPIDTATNDIAGLAGVIEEAHTRLGDAIAESEKTFQQRKGYLAQLAADIDSLELTPHQQALVANARPAPPELSFGEWIRDRNVYYGLLINFLTSGLFFLLGLRYPTSRYRRLCAV
jgi:hypothetical protein